ncbi:hypothetical protein [Actinophytocola sp.]|uniref:hypothetical protein n=1 Tax=Actinophytocola sp. TaxID=1872138 RepID=UPI00389A89E3
MTVQYIGAAALGEALGVSRHAVHKWRSRYPAGSSHPFPEPDIEIDGTPGWRPNRVADVARWRDGLPGRGAGGGRPTAARQEYFMMATKRGLDRDEAVRALQTFVDEFPEMTEAEVCAWLIGKWTD